MAKVPSLQAGQHWSSVCVKIKGVGEEEGEACL